MGALDSMWSRLVSLGYTVEERDFGMGNWAIYLDDPDGNVFELTERTTLWDGTPAADLIGVHRPRP